MKKHPEVQIRDVFSSPSTSQNYDANGNMVGDGRFNYSYDAANRMVDVTEYPSGEKVEQYFYDHAGKRVKKVEVTPVVTRRHTTSPTFSR